MKRREQLIIVGVAVAVVLAGFWFALLGPKVKQVKELGTQLSAAQSRRTQALASAANAQAAQRSYVSNVKVLASLTPAIPPVDAAPTLLREIDAAANTAGVDFNTITLGAGGSAAGPSAPAGTPGAGAAASKTPPIPPGYSPTSSAGVPSVSYSLTFAGNYLKLQKFIAAMQQFVTVHNGAVNATGRLIDVQGINVQNGTVSANVTAYLLAPSDQTPLPVPRSAPTVAPGTERAATPARTKTTKVAVSGGSHS
jgi:hypothetical protein